MDHDKDYPFLHRTKLYRELQTLCSKVYMMHGIANNYNQDTFSAEKTGLLKPKEILAGYPHVLEHYAEHAPGQTKIDSSHEFIGLKRLESSQVKSFFENMLMKKI